MSYTIAQAAAELDTTTEVLTTLVGQISDDPDLWDEEAGTLTDAGMSLLRDQIASEDSFDPTLEEVEEATAAYREAADALDEGRGRRDRAIRAAVAYGHPKARVAATAGISREMLYRIIN